MSAPTNGLDAADLLQAAFDLQRERDAARGELAELRGLASAVVAGCGFCEDSLCTMPICVLGRFLDRPVAE